LFVGTLLKPDEPRAYTLTWLLKPNEKVLDILPHPRI
jgi:hypothetical protein